VTAAAKHPLFWVRVAIPVGLLAYIFSRVDIPDLLEALRHVDLPLALLSLLIGYLVPVPLCAWRWRTLMRQGYGVEMPLGFLVKHFWIGMFVGYLLPGGAGTDVYRIACLSRHRGRVKENAAVVVGEKLFVLLANALLVMLAYPWIASSATLPEGFDRLVWLVYALGWLGLGLLVLLTLLRRPVGDWLERVIGHRVMAIGRRLNVQTGEGEIRSLLRPFTRWRNQALIFLWTVGIQLIACYGGRLMLLAVGVDLPLMVHIFVWNLMIFVFLLPISFGTLGVREATFIAFFGMFGVAREPALAASFVGLASMLITVGVGGILWAAAELKKRVEPSA